MTARNGSNSPWTPKKEEQLRKLWEDGTNSAAKIGKKLGMTKGAIIGKINRMGFIQGACGASLQSSQTTPPLRSQSAAQKPTLLPKETAHTHNRSKPTPLGRCKWPIGDPGDLDYHDCGDPAIDGKPYCKRHCDTAYASNANPDPVRDARRKIEQRHKERNRSFQRGI